MRRARFLISILFLFIFTNSLACSGGKKLLPQKEQLPIYFQDISVCVSNNRNNQASGVVARNRFILTAGHVVKYSFKNNKAIKVISPVYGVNRKEIGRMVAQAEVISYSKPIFGYDIAVLILKEDILTYSSAVFENEDFIPKLATEVWHCGCFLGYQQSNSVVSGRVSAIGRTKIFGPEIENEFDQLDIGAYPGSSGGGVYSAEGKYIGMMQIGTSINGNMFLMCPIRIIHKWAKEEKMEWLFDDSLPIPEDIKKIEYKPDNLP